jgi:Ankyrin repeats (3 copies)
MKKDSKSRIKAAQIRRKSDFPGRSRQFSSSIENYFPEERKYRASLIGEIRLDRSIHRLSTPSFEDLEKPKPNLKPKQPETQRSVLEFLELASKPIKKRKDFRFCLMRSIKDLESIKLQSNEIKNLIPTSPYEPKESKKFLKLCKNGNSAIIECLDANPSLVYSYDSLLMTGLHWAALRNYLIIVKILINYNAIIDSIDSNHRTPLFIAAKAGHLDVCKILLIHKADPTIPSNSNKPPIKVSKNIKIIEMLKKVTFFHIKNQNLSKKLREANWKDIVIPYINDFK